MSATTQTRPAGVVRGPSSPAGSLRARIGAVRDALSRPLATYYLLLGATAMLLGIGLIMVLSASSVYSYRQYHDSYHIFFKQAMWVLIGLPCAWIASRQPERRIRWFAWPFLGLSSLLLILTQTNLGVMVNGNQNWLALGPFQVQPSELAKLALVLWAADVYARKEKLLGSWKHQLVPVVPVTGAVLLLVLLGGDLGTSMVLLTVILAMLWNVGAPLRLFVLAASLAGSGALYLAASAPYRLARLVNFSDPFRDYQGTGWQAAHGLLGLASGGIFGKGIGASQQKWGNLPEAHTDFIFAVIGEELGLIGTLLLLVLFAVLAYAGIRTALHTRSSFARYAASGIVVWLMVHVMINVGMVLALFPVIGIPLPLVSYGGSSLVTELVALGLLLGFARREPEAAAALRARKRQRQGRRQVALDRSGAR
ncbi:MAG: putative lipid II flippase FtsW [Marmoricola sp.]